MKRLFTIFLSSLAVFSLCGQQKLPMAIYGDVYNVGPVNAVGPVHLEAGATTLPTGVAKVANYGSNGIFQMDSVIFYTNDSLDGLLMNQNTAANSVPTNQVAVRKTFTKSNSWYMMVLPFDVNLSTGVVNPLTGTPLVKGTDFEVQYYNSQYRADNGQNVDAVWQTFTGTTMVKGTGYRVAVKLTKLAADTTGASAGRFRVDFLGVPADNPGLFAKTTKGINLTYAHSPVGKFTAATVANSEGWNVFGGLNSTEYKIAAWVNPSTRPTVPLTTVNYTKTIYYRIEATTGITNWQEYNPQDPTIIQTMRPYAPMFVQTDSSYLNNTSKQSYSSGGGFQFLGANGITLDPESTSSQEQVLFRATSNAPYDLVRLNLTDDKSNLALAYFKFDNSYNTSFNGTEDDLMITTTSATKPIVYSLVAPSGSTENLPVFNNGLPYTESVVPLGVNIPVTGTYTFSLSEILVKNSITSAVLKDTKNNNQKTELLQGDIYTFQANAGVDENRFLLYFNSKVMTSIDQVGTSEVYAYANNNTLTVKNLSEGDKVQVVDVAGRVFASGIATGNTYSTTLNQKGVYIVNVRGEKVTTLKVLNK